MRVRYKQWSANRLLEIQKEDGFNENSPLPINITPVEGNQTIFSSSEVEGKDNLS